MKKKILLVDDDTDLVFQNKCVLEGKGYEVDSVNTGAQAITYLETHKPDLMVVDVMMEHATAGLNLANTVAEKYKDIPVIILSGDPQKPNWMMQPGRTWDMVRAFLDKPVTPEKLLATVQQVLG